MTICNMTIEGGGRAGMIAPDETTFDWVEGRPGAPEDFEEALAYWRTLQTDEGATFDREITVDASAVSPARHLGDEPRPGRAGVASAVPAAAAPRPTSARWSTWAWRPARRCSELKLDRVFIGSCTNAPDRRPARRRGDDQGPAGWPRRVSAMVVPGSQQVAKQAETRGPGRDLPRRRLRLAHRGLLDVPGHEPGHPRAGRALRVDLEPQLRGPPGPRRAHPPRVPADGRRRRDRGPLRRHPGVELDGSRSRSSPARVTSLKRADVDTDQIIPKQFLKRIERTGFGEFLFYDWAQEPGWIAAQEPDPRHRRELRLRVRAASTRRGRCRTTASRRSSRPPSPTSSSPTAPRSACCRSCCPRRRCRR